MKHDNFSRSDFYIYAHVLLQLQESAESLSDKQDFLSPIFLVIMLLPLPCLLTLLVLFLPSVLVQQVSSEDLLVFPALET